MPITNDLDLAPAAQFMQSASRNFVATKSFILRGLEQTLKLGGVSENPVKHALNVNVRYPDDSMAFHLLINIVIDKAPLVSEILSASLPHKLSLKGFHVLSGDFSQPRLVLLLDNRVVGQLFCSSDGESLRLEIEERPDARDMGNAVLALGRLKVSAHTPIGSASADSIH